MPIVLWNHLGRLPASALSLLLVVWGVPNIWGQTKTDADVLSFTDGERLTGHFVKAAGSSLTFKSDVLGEVTVDWSQVRELESSAKVAVIPKGVRLRKRGDATNIPQGTLSMRNQELRLTTAPAPAPRPTPVTDLSTVVEQSTFEQAVLHEPGLFEAWKGTVTVGAAVVNATQNSESFNGAVSLVRSVPTVNWLEPRNRTSLNLNAAYGEVMQPASPTIKTAIFHGDAEHDEYFRPRLYGFGQGAFDHNFSQGLDLEQTYGGGIGWTVIQQSNETLDLKTSVSYVRQEFTGVPNQDLIGSIFAEALNRKFRRGMTLDQHLSITPTWNDAKYYSAAFNALLTMPVYKRINGSAGFIDTFLNNPPPGFRKNSLQLTIGLTYVLP
jgi:hypothetical protein